MSGLETVACPFCKEKDFDLIGLKNHLFYYCKDFEKTNSVTRKTVNTPDSEELK